MVKKFSVIILVIMTAFFALTSCTTTGNTEAQADNSSPASSQQTDSVEQTSSLDSGITVISKSDNAVVDADKQKVISDLNNEIDDLINNVNALDDIQDSDLTFE